MKKQRILALTLAATTAMSVFGGMSASAVYDDAYKTKSFNTNALDVSTNSSVNLSNIYLGSYEDAIADGIDENKIYLFNYTADPKNNATLDTVIEKIEAAIEAGDVVNGDASGDKSDDVAFDAAMNELKNYFGGSSESISMELGTNINLMTSTRKAVVDLYNTQLDFYTNVYDKNLYETVDVEGYAVETLKGDIEKAKALDKSTSELLYLAAEGERIATSLGVVTSYEEMYRAKYDEIAALDPADYTAANYRKIERALEDAEDMAADGTEKAYKKAYEYLRDLKVETITPDWSELKTAVEGLFTDKKPADGIYTGTGNCLYDINDYKVKDGVYTDEWYAFAGKTGNSDERIVGAYEKAYDVYYACKYSSTRKYVAQSTVDKVLGELNDSLMALDPNYDTANWVIVMLEDALAKTESIVETDYNTKSTYWKKYEKAVADVEDLLARPAVKKETAEAAVKALEDAITNINKAGCRLTVPAATKTEAKNLYKEATTLQKDLTNKTASQIIALRDAVDAYEALTTTSTISAYETVIADLEAAITGYKQIQGWYQENGKWYYGIGDKKATGWLNVNGTYYYLNADGSMVTGWFQDSNGTYYYLKDNGAMATGWLNLNGTYYYLKSWGGMATGWQQINGTWYYFQSWGGMVSNGWYTIGGKSYYFYNWGGMAANTTINGWKVGADGAWVK